jgi:hypothetical protein
MLRACVMSSAPCSLRISLICAALSLTSLIPTVAHAGEAEAAEHFASGSKAFERADFTTAAKEFERAYTEAPHPAPLYNAGLAWVAAGKPDHAADAFAVALSLEGLSPEQKLDATRRLDASARTLAVVKLTGVPSSAKARIDDGPLFAGSTRFHATQGEHEVFVTFEGGKTDSRKLAVPRTDGTEIEVSFTAPVGPDAPARPLDIKLVIGLGLLGGAVVFGASAIGTGAAGLSARDDYVTARALHSPNLASLRDDAVSLKVATNVLWGFAGAALAAGGALTVFSLMTPSSSESASLSVAPDRVALTIAF